MSTKKVIRKKELVQAISKKTGFAQPGVLEVLNTMDEAAAELLAAAARDGEEASIRLGRGMSLTCVWQEPAERRNPKTGEKFMAPGKYKVKAKMTGVLRDINDFIG